MISSNLKDGLDSGYVDHELARQLEFRQQEALKAEKKALEEKEKLQIQEEERVNALLLQNSLKNSTKPTDLKSPEKKSLLDSLKINSPFFKNNKKNVSTKTTHRSSPLAYAISALDGPSLQEAPLSAISEKSTFLCEEADLFMEPVEQSLNTVKIENNTSVELTEKYVNTRSQCLNELVQAQKTFVDQMKALEIFYFETIPALIEKDLSSGKKSKKKHKKKGTSKIEPLISRHELNILQKHVRELTKLSYCFFLKLDHMDCSVIGKLFLDAFNLTLCGYKDNFARQFIDYINNSSAPCDLLKNLTDKSEEFRDLVQVNRRATLHIFNHEL